MWAAGSALSPRGCGPAAACAGSDGRRPSPARLSWPGGCPGEESAGENQELHDGSLQRESREKRKRRRGGPHLDVGDAGTQGVLHPGREVVSLLLRQTLRGCRDGASQSELKMPAVRGTK